MDTVSRVHPDVTFVYQPDQLGTGHATRIGVGPLRIMDYRGPILLTMGDKLISPHVVSNLIETFNSVRLDAVLSVMSVSGRSDDGGRLLIYDDGRLAGIVEKRDIDKLEILESIATMSSELSANSEIAAVLEGVARQAEASFKDIGKRRRALGKLADILEARDWNALANEIEKFGELENTVILGKRRFTLEDLKQAPYRNAALYLFKAEALYEGLEHMSTDNAQGEE